MKIEKLLRFISKKEGWEYNGSYKSAMHNTQYWFQLPPIKAFTAINKICLQTNPRDPLVLTIGHARTLHPNVQIWGKYSKIDLRHPNSVNKLKNFFADFKQEYEKARKCGIITSAKRQMKAAAGFLTSLINSMKEKWRSK